MIKPMAAIGLMVFLLGMSPPIQPLPPVNWEADADPRFSPPIEQVILDNSGYGTRRNDQALVEQWHAWGVEAIEPLQKLLQAPLWQPFSDGMIHLLYLCPFEEAVPALQAELDKQVEVVAAAGFESEAMRTFRNHLLQAALTNPDLVRPLLRHSDPRVWTEALGVLVRNTGAISPDLQPRFEELANSENPDDRTQAVYLLQSVPTPENNKRTMDLAATVSEELVKNTRAAQGRMAPFERAQEPMRLILEKEKGGKR